VAGAGGVGLAGPPEVAAQATQVTQANKSRKEKGRMDP
jgi:hypothetical protein